MDAEDTTSQRGYAVGLLSKVLMGEDIVEYLRRIDGTLATYFGRFLIHGNTANEVEGSWPGDLIVIEFPSMEHAVHWYNSEAYQKIVTLRTANAEGSVALFRGVENPHLATDILVGSRHTEHVQPDDNV